MSKQIYSGRYAPHYDRDFVMYVFGMRINKPLQVSLWMHVVKYAFQMRTWLRNNPQAGMLRIERAIVHGCPAMVTYWRSFEDLEAFARDRENIHMDGWHWYNTKAHQTGAVGMWHEMYQVRAGATAGIYAHLPRIGLAAIGEHRPVGSTLRTAAQRMGLRAVDDGPPNDVTGADPTEYEINDRLAARPD
jgi:hypothetical protein